MTTLEDMITRCEENIIKQCYDLAEEFYDENSCEYVYNFNHYDTLMDIANNPGNITKNQKRINKMLRLAESDYEWEELDTLSYVFREYTHYLNMKYERQINNLPIKRKLNDLKFFIQQFDRFDGFKDNQNNFDNYISLLKIIQRFNMRSVHQKKTKIIFNQNNFNVNETEEKLKQELIYDEFKNLIFKYKIMEIEA